MDAPRFHLVSEFNLAVTCETVAVNLDEVIEIEAIPSQPATVTRLIFQAGEVRLVHETVSEIIALMRIAVERKFPTAALH